MPHGHTSTFYGAEVIEDGRVRLEPGYLTDFWTERAIRFLEENRERPFFLYLAYNGPYNLGASLNHPGRNRHAAEYADMRGRTTMASGQSLRASASPIGVSTPCAFAS